MLRARDGKELGAADGRLRTADGKVRGATEGRLGVIAGASKIGADIETVGYYVTAQSQPRDLLVEHEMLSPVDMLAANGLQPQWNVGRPTKLVLGTPQYSNSVIAPKF